ncbi:MAG: nitroreductase family deazaflavin-dependent oxidoreductase [Chloroflexi bacterium]|nr:MAG: nitroreductase family deazaflavin-dependent oxidoreductase [Chloroflexota bacterium]
MIRKPNVLQKIVHRFLMLRPVTAFFAPWIHQVDKAILKLTKGKYTLSEMIGWDIIQLTTKGAKTGQPRTMPLVGLFDGEKIALIASSFGRERNPAWYYNLEAHPECKVQSSKRTGTYIARESEGDEYEKYWQLGVSYYAGYEKYKERAGRKIPVMVLEPKKPG